MQVLLKGDNFSSNPASFHYLICTGLQTPPLHRTVCLLLQFTKPIHNLQFIYHLHFIGGKTQAKENFEVGWRPHSTSCLPALNHFTKIYIRLPLPMLSSAGELSWDLRVGGGTCQWSQGILGAHGGKLLSPGCPHRIWSPGVDNCRALKGALGYLLAKGK